MDSGYVKLWRKSIYSPLFSNSNLWMFWCWCLMKASHKATEIMVGFTMVELKSGQFVFGRKAAAEELPMSEWTIRTCVRVLVDRHKVTTQTTNRFTLITI